MEQPVSIWVIPQFKPNNHIEKEREREREIRLSPNPHAMLSSLPCNGILLPPVLLWLCSLFGPSGQLPYVCCENNGKKKKKKKNKLVNLILNSA